MSTKTIAPRLADRLCSLAESQLQTQVSRSGTLANEQALTRKDPLLAAAVTLLVPGASEPDCPVSRVSSG